MNAIEAQTAEETLFGLELRPPLRVAKTAEAQLLRWELQRDPTAGDVRSRLARVLYGLDRFDEAVELFEELGPEDAGAHELLILADCYFARERPEDDARAADCATRAMDRAGSAQTRAAAAASLGKALKRQGRRQDALRVLSGALEDDPTHVVAFRRLVTMRLKDRDGPAALAATEAFLKTSPACTDALVARTLAFGLLGDVEPARETIGLDRNLLAQVLQPPSGYATVEAFNADVRAELERHPDILFNRYGKASVESWRVDNPLIAGSVAVRALLDMIRSAVVAHVEAISRSHTAWSAARPRTAILHSWSVLTGAEGFEQWHVHSSGWMSGVYYVDVPPPVLAGDARDGCIAFGLPGDIVGVQAAEAYGEEIVRPQNGLLLLFPSHTFHRTYPHGGDHRRICLAFDVVPSDPG